MKSEQLPQSEAPIQETFLTRFINGSRALFTPLIFVAGCATAHIPSVAEKQSLLRDNAVEEACSKLGRIQVSGKKLPPELKELNRMCTEKESLEAQMVQIQRQKVSKK